MIALPIRFKQLANELAARYASDEGARRLAAIRQAASGPRGPRPTVPPAPAGKRRVGIWEEQQNKAGRTVFMRARGIEPWHLWAEQHQIAPKAPNARRVVLVGESVARGFFYDPVFNPAIALRAMFAAAAPGHPIEVVDLARTDQLLAPLQQLIDASVALEPDVLVVFAGNNWHPAISFDRRDFMDVAARIRAGEAWRQIKEQLEARLTGQVEAFLRHLAAIGAQHRIPVVFVLPEGNLVDWRDDCPAPPLFDAEATARWIARHDEATRAVADGDHVTAARVALELVELDGGTTAAGPALLAQVALDGGRLDEARRWLELARDSAICWPRPEAPRCYSAAQAIVRRDAPALGLTLVDVPTLFAEYLPNEVPGRRLFLDYCHFSVEGVRVAMAGVADAVLTALGGSPGWRQLARTTLNVSPQADACAHLLAAIHNARWNQRRDVIRHHCETAVARWPPIADIMRLFLDFYVRRAPSWACGSFERLAQLQNTSLLTHLFNPRSMQADKPLHAGLVAELSRAVARQAPGFERTTAALLESQHGVAGRDLDLLKNSYYLEPMPPSPDRRAAAFVRMFEHESAFQIVCGEPTRLSLRLVHREPSAAPGAIVCFLVNDVEAATVQASRHWRNEAVELDAAYFTSGLNRVVIRWPVARWSETTRREELAERLEQGEMPDVRGVHGELFRLTGAWSPVAEAGDRAGLLEGAESVT